MLEKIKTKIKQIFLQKDLKKALFFVFFFLFVFFIFQDTIFAASTNAISSDDSDLAKNMNYILKWLQYIIGISGALIGGLTAVVSILLDPSWINGTMFGIGDHLRDIWVFVSNVVYFIFAGILIFISFMNIIGKGGNNFELKKALPRFVIGVLIVPVSWFMVQFIISIASVLTVQIFTWPIEKFSSEIAKNNLGGVVVPEWCDHRVLNIQGSSAESSSQSQNNTNANKEIFSCKENSKKNKTLQEILSLRNEKTNEIRIGGVFAIYSFGIMDVGTVSTVLKGDLDIIKTIFDLGAKVIFDFIFILIYLIILIALFLTLFIRFIMMWLFMAMSPIFGLLYFFSDSKGALQSLSERLGFGEFIRLAFVPVYVAAALSFGLMFLLVIGQGLNSPKLENLIPKDGIDLGATKLSINGSFGDAKNQNTLVNALFRVADDGAGVINFLIFKLLGLAFLWIAVMAALKGPKATERVVDPFDKLGKSVGNLALDLPKYIPIPGTNKLTGGQGNINVGSITGGLQRAMDSFGQAQIDKERKFADNLFGSRITEAQREMYKKIDSINDKTDFKKMFKEVGIDDMLKDFRARERFADKMLSFGVSRDLSDKFRSTTKKQDMLDLMKKINDSVTGAGGGIFGDRGDSIDTLNREYSKPASSDSQASSTTTTSNNITIGDIQITGVQGLGDKSGDKYKVADPSKIASSIYNKIPDKYFVDKSDLERELREAFDENNDKINEIIEKLEEQAESDSTGKKLYKPQGNSPASGPGANTSP